MSCHKINGFRAQQNLLIGRELDKNNMKLEKARSLLAVEKEELARASNILMKTTDRWKHEWLTTCDELQLIEEDRIDKTKMYLWSFANALSQLCVSDDESCERLRVALESCDATHDLNAFIRKSGDGKYSPNRPISSSASPLDSAVEGMAIASRRSVSPVDARPSISRLDQHRQSPQNGPATATISSPLDGLTQLCRADSRATMSSIGTEVSVSRAKPFSQHINGRFTKDTGSVPARPKSSTDLYQSAQPRQSFVDRVEQSWPKALRISKDPIEDTRRVRTQKGKSMFDILSPSRTRSRSESRSQSQLSIGRPASSLLPEFGTTRSAHTRFDQHQSTPSAMTDTDAITIALERLKSSERSLDYKFSNNENPLLDDGSLPRSRASIAPSAHDSQKYVSSDLAIQSKRISTSNISNGEMRVGPGDLRRSPSPHAANQRTLRSHQQQEDPGSVVEMKAQDTHHSRATPDSARPRSRSYLQPHDPSEKAVEPSSMAQEQRRHSAHQSTAYATTMIPDRHISQHRSSLSSNHHSFEDKSRLNNEARFRAAQYHSPSAMPTQDRTYRRNAVALYDYQAAIPEEIGFCAGDVLAVLDMRADGWWIGQLTNVKNSRQGLVPSNFFRLL